MGFLNTAKITAIDILRQTYEYMSEQYAMSDSVFTPSSPTGQIMHVCSQIAELIFLYLEHAASELNIQRAQTPESIHGIARLTGHDPFRGCAARGILRMKLNPAKINLVEGSFVKILDETNFVIDENGSQYFLNLGQDYIILTLGDEPVTVEFVQGVKNKQTFTSNGEHLQSYNVNEKGMTDHDRVSVTVNGEKWKKVESLYDMGLDEKCFMCKSSINMGLTVFFGNGDFGKIPENGSIIEVSYISHIGNMGNVGGNNINYEFTSAGYDENNNTVNLNDVLSIETELPPCMGSNYEAVELTRRLAPHQSKSFVLANPENYISYLSKFSQFSFVNAYNTKDDGYLEDDNVVYLQILPNIKNKISRTSSTNDYFSLPLDEFTLTNDEKRSIIKAIDDSGRQLISSEVVINDIKIKKYAIVVVLKYFENFDKNQIRNDIRNKLNTYFININRCDMIPKSDIISVLENINGVDSTNVYFISEENEKAIRDGYYLQETKQINPYTHLYEKHTKRIVLKENEDPMLGLDSFGDIKIKENEIAVIKGGWLDRWGNEFKEEITQTDLCGLTIIFSSATENNLYNVTQQANFNKILNQNG